MALPDADGTEEAENESLMADREETMMHTLFTAFRVVPWPRGLWAGLSGQRPEESVPGSSSGAVRYLPDKLLHLRKSGSIVRPTPPAVRAGDCGRGRRTFLSRLALSVLITALAWAAPLVSGQEAGSGHRPAPTEEPLLYVTATAHLDTQWLWTIQTTIDEYIPATLRDNFALFEKYPNYVFSFEGAFRYMLAREYYPEDYARLKEYVAQGRWRVCGSVVDAGDVNVPSPESLIRHILYGNNFFEREFGRRSCDIYLPDCFGFGYALPSVAAHCGLKGFSTQKLTWGSSVGIPFDIGVWEGVDGAAIVAALNPGDYVSKIRNDLSTDEEWLARINKVGGQSGAYVGYKYFGVGDRGGAPDDESVAWLEKAIAGDGPIRVVSAPADQLYRDLTPVQIERLPRYKGEMLMTRHGTGCYTSQAAMKRWNRKNELLADTAERAAVVADWLGGATYPRAALEQAWIRFLWHQFHDDLTGTSIPQAYPFSWNDEIISLKQFAGVLTNAAGAVARALDTRGEGVSLVVFNPLAFEREDVVTARVRFPGRAPDAVRVYAPDGQEVPSQVKASFASEVEVLFPARVPSVGFAVFDVRPAEEPCALSTGLAVTESTLENDRYRIRLDQNGDVAGIYDKELGRELLAGPVRLELLHNTPAYWSEWEVRYEDVAAKPYAFVGAPAKVEVTERGPVRATIEVRREAEGSTFIQRLRLAAGDAGDRLEFDTVVDWRTPRTLLKVAYPLAASNEMATYDLGFGVIERANNTEKKYEVPAQQWADVTTADGSLGVSILNDCKYGWDKPNDHTIRLTLIHAPNDVEKDMGWHRMTYALTGHRGDWRTGRIVEGAARLNQPLAVFQTAAHPGPLGKRFSMLDVESDQIAVRALKLAEKTDEIVVRLQEAHGLSAPGVRVASAAPISAAREVNGAEEHLRDVEIHDGQLAADFAPYQPRTFALTLAPPEHSLSLPTARPVDLPFDLDVVSCDRSKADGDFDGVGHTLPAELLPSEILHGDIPFAVGPTADGENNAVVCRGQTISLPSGEFNRLYVLAAAVDGPATGTFTVGDESTELSVHDFTGWVGQADSLVGENGRTLNAHTMAPGFIHRDEIGWVGTHRHNGATGRNEPYVFCYLFRYGFDLPPGADTVTHPDNDRIRVLAMTVANNPNDETVPAGALHDQIDPAYIRPSGGLFIDPVTVTLATDVPGAEIVYTLDGSEPTRSSPRSPAPFELADTATVSARVLHEGTLEDFVSRATFTFTEPREADHPTNVVPGLEYHYYEGEWKKLPEFDALAPAQSGTVASFDLTPRARDDQYGFYFTGFVRVPHDGVYTFYTSSDDGSRLYIGDVEVVDNDGLHGQRERFGRTALKAGLHPIRVSFFERGGSDALEVYYKGPGIEKALIPAGALYHQDGGAPPERAGRGR